MNSNLIAWTRSIFRNLDTVRINYILLLGGSGISVIISFLVMKLIKFRLGQVEFEVMVLILRYSGFIVPALCCGMGVAIPRYMGAQIERRSQHDLTSIVGTGYITVLTTIAVFVTLINFEFFQVRLNELLFNNANYIFILGIYSSLLALYAITYAVARGAQHFAQNEILNFLIIGFPSIAIAYFSNSIQTYFIVVAALNLCLSLTLSKKYFNWIRLRFSKEIFTFGAKRVFGDLVFPLLTLLPTIAIVKMSGTSKGAEFGFNLMLVNGALIILNPISTLLLPRSVRLSTDRFFLNKLIRYSIVTLLMAPPIIFLVNLFVTQLFFSNDNIQIAVVVAIGGGFLSQYLLARSIIDGAYHQPRLLYIMVLALLAESVVVGVAYIVSVPNLSVYSYIVGMAILGTVSLLELKRLVKNAN